MLKGEQAELTEQVRYRCWRRRGRQQCRWVLVGVGTRIAGGVMVDAFAVGDVYFISRRKFLKALGTSGALLGTRNIYAY